MSYYDLFEGEIPSFRNRIKQSIELKKSVNQRRKILLSPVNCIEAQFLILHFTFLIYFPPPEIMESCSIDSVTVSFMRLILNLIASS